MNDGHYIIKYFLLLLILENTTLVATVFNPEESRFTFKIKIKASKRKSASHGKNKFYKSLLFLVLDKNFYVSTPLKQKTVA